MKNKKLLLSVITPTLNNQKHIKHFLESVKKQKNPSFKVEVLIVDGGSKDETRKIAAKYKCKIINNPFILADPGVNLGIKEARGDIFIILAVDNIFEDRRAFEKILAVFEDKTITAGFPLHTSSKKDSWFTKYINNFTDPFNHFVYGYGSNGKTFKKIYTTLESNKVYDVYDYSSHPDRPLIAVAQGFTIRKGFTRNRNSRFDDILPVIELLEKRKKIAFVHSVKLYHHTVRDTRHFVNKQMWATINALQGKNYGIAHRFSYLSINQRIRAKIWPLYALSFILPALWATYGLIRDRQGLWILHPILCIMSAYASILGTIKFLINKNADFKRK